MRNEEILNALKNVKKGRYVSLRKIKDLGEGIVKESDMIIRLGVSYQNMSINEGRTVESLPWGHWLEGLENLVIEHTKKDKKTGEESTSYYLRVSSTNPEHPDNGADVVATRYLRNGVIIPKEEVVAILGEKKITSSASAVYNIKFENIESLGVC